jgi:hypothetical protein
MAEGSRKICLDTDIIIDYYRNIVYFGVYE